MIVDAETAEAVTVEAATVAAVKVAEAATGIVATVADVIAIVVRAGIVVAIVIGTVTVIAIAATNVVATVIGTPTSPAVGWSHSKTSSSPVSTTDRAAIDVKGSAFGPALFNAILLACRVRSIPIRIIKLSSMLTAAGLPRRRLRSSGI